MMSKVMQGTTKQSKRERQRAAVEVRASIRRRRAQRRTLAYVLGGFGVIAVAALAIISFADLEEGRAAIAASPQGEVTASGPARTEPLGSGETAPSFSAPGFRVVSDAETGLPTVRREELSWSRGEPTVISVWAPWCPHCQAELPVLARVARAFPDVTFVTVVTSIGTSPGPDAGAFMADNGITMPTAIDDARGTLSAALGIQGFPTLYFVGSDGTVTQMAEGEVDEGVLRGIIGSLI